MMIIEEWSDDGQIRKDWNEVNIWTELVVLVPAINASDQLPFVVEEKTNSADGTAIV